MSGRESRIERGKTTERQGERAREKEIERAGERVRGEGK